MSPVRSRTLVIGGARSGKSGTAERLLEKHSHVVYIATAYPPDEESGATSGDTEWADRIRIHRQRRPPTWRTLETIDLVPLLAAQGPPLLIDCLTLWLTRVMDRHAAWTTGDYHAVEAEIDQLVQAWRDTERVVVAVTNELGQGVVPEAASVRRFRDLMGSVNTRIAAESGDVLWCVAGRVVTL